MPHTHDLPCRPSLIVSFLRTRCGISWCRYRVTVATSWPSIHRSSQNKADRPSPSRASERGGLEEGLDFSGYLDRQLAPHSVLVRLLEPQPSCLQGEASELQVANPQPTQFSRSATCLLTDLSQPRKIFDRWRRSLSWPKEVGSQPSWHRWGPPKELTYPDQSTTSCHECSMAWWEFDGDSFDDGLIVCIRNGSGTEWQPQVLEGEWPNLATEDGHDFWESPVHRRCR